MTMIPPALTGNDALPPKRSRSSPFRFLFDHNPCFLLSALSMFLGCYLVNSALNVRTGDTSKLFALLATINLYEIALLLIGVMLLRRASRNRDGVLLLLIQMLFLADGPFVLAETAMASPLWGWLFNLALLLLAIAKATLAFRALRIPLRARTLGFLLLQLTLIYVALPCFFSRVETDGNIAAAPMYLAWSIVGLLPVAYDLLACIDLLPADIHRTIRRSYIVVPWLLLIAHLGFYQYAYRAPFTIADLSPILLGITIATLRLRPTKFLTASDLRIVQVILPLIALFFALATPDALPWPASVSLAFSPVRITLPLVILTWAYAISLRASICTLAALTLLLTVHTFGPSLRTITTTFDRASDLFFSIIPQTSLAWGILSIIAAFTLLALGGLFTLRTKPRSA